MIIYFFQACAPSVPKQTALMEQVDAVQVSAQQIRILLIDFSYRFSGLVEETADEIIYSDADSEIKVNAHLWKMYAIPVVSSSVFIDDPLAALFDVTVFCVQMHLYFETGLGKHIFGPYQSKVLETSIWLERDLFRLAEKMSAGKDIADYKQEIYNWSKDNPLRNILFTRKSTIELFSRFMGGDESSFGAIIGNVTANLDDLSKQVTLLSHILPRQARWQAEYVAYNMLKGPEMEAAFRQIGSISKSLSYVDTVFSGDEQRVANLLRLPFAEIDRQRRETLISLTKELEKINKLIREERVAVLNEIDRERLDTISELNKASVRIIEQNMASLVDHVFLRLVQLLAILFIFALIITFMYRKRRIG
jgi:hypothetical protein